MKILLLVSAFNGLTQRAWCALQEAGHDVTVELAPVYDTPEKLTAMVHASAPEIILCPFLKHKVPAEVWGKWPTIIIHPGPIGDRGPSSLDYAIMDGNRQWGVTALSAVEDMDAGPVWASRIFPMPAEPISKAALYNSAVADAAMSCIEEVIEKAADPQFSPIPQEEMPQPVPHVGTRPLIRRDERVFDWEDSATEIVRRVRAADSSPGVRTNIDGQTVHVYDAAVGERRGRRVPPGTIVGRGDDAIAVATGDNLVWIGAVRRPVDCGGDGIKLPATMIFNDPSIPELPVPEGLRQTSYTREGDVGFLTIRAYNGAMSTMQCARVAGALKEALDQDTKALVVLGTPAFFSNGIHLNVIEAANDPNAEAWDNIHAINDLCTALVSCTNQLTISAFTANAGAGGVMFGLAADVVLARDGVVLNPYYDIGLYGSELHTYTLPRRVSPPTATKLLTQKLPVNTDQAATMGLVDAVGPRDWNEFREWLSRLARSYTSPQWYDGAMATKLQVLDRTRPASYYEAHELSEMAKDIFDDRSGFDASRADFVYKRPASHTPPRIAQHRWRLSGLS